MLEVDERVGPYVIRRYLTIGASSEVYEASSDEGPVALKILREDKRHEPMLPWRMTNEALALRRVSHPGVVALRSHDVYNGRPYLALELLGCSLAQRPPSTPQQAVSLTISLAHILAALHAANIVHRDLKPQNVMLTADGQLKLIDFGLSKLPVATATAEAPLIPLSTEPGTFFGTYEYVSPEQIEDAKHVDGRADVYSLGIMLFEMLAGRRPFMAKERGRLISMHLNAPPPSLSSLVNGLPPSLVALVSRMLAKQPAARPDANAVAEELARLAFSPRRTRAAWLCIVPLLALPLYSAPTPPPPSLDSILERQYSLFEQAVFTSTITEASTQLRTAAGAMSLYGPPSAYQEGKFRYKDAALAKERGAITESLRLYKNARERWSLLIPSQPGPAYKALSICADGMGEMYYHLGEYEQALRLYEEAAHTLPRTLAAAQSTRQVPSFLDYQRALVYRDQDDAAAALAALDDAEGHERVLLAQPDAASADQWQLARVLTLRAEILLGQNKSDGAYAAATEAESRARNALAQVPNEKRYKLGYLLAAERLDEIIERRGQMPPQREQDPLTGLRKLVQSDPENGQWVHALTENLVRRAQRIQGVQRREFTKEAVDLIQQMKSRSQWDEDRHLRNWSSLLAKLAGS